MMDGNGNERMFGVRWTAWTADWQEVVTVERNNLSLYEASKEAVRLIKAKVTPWTFEGFGMGLPLYGEIASVSVEVFDQSIDTEGVQHGKG